jgi:hypothetical protein
MPKSDASEKKVDAYLPRRRNGLGQSDWRGVSGWSLLGERLLTGGEGGGGRHDRL